MSRDKSQIEALASAQGAQPASNNNQQPQSAPEQPEQKEQAQRQRPAAQRDSRERNEMYTVSGNLKRITANNSPLMRRAAAQGKEQASDRGLSNSTIAIGAAQGAVLDRAVDIAKGDAAAFNERKTEEMRRRTAIESANISANAQRFSAQQATERTRMDIQSRESTMFFQELNRANIAEQDRAARERIAEMDNTTRERLAQAEIDFNRSKLEVETRSRIYEDMATSISNIDIRAKPASQEEQARRIMEFGTIRLEANGYMDEAIAASLGSRTPAVPSLEGPEYQPKQ